MGANIIIPCLNLVEHTKLCIESVKKHTKYPYRILAIDDASKDGTAKYLEKEGIETITHSSNLGWWKCLNEGIKHSKADYYALLDRDCIVSPLWLTKLIESFTKLENVGIVSPVSNAGPENYGSQCLHFTSPKFIRKYFKSRNPYNPERIYWQISLPEIEEFSNLVEKEYSMRYDYQTPLFFFAVVLSKETVKKVGLLDERYKTWHADLEYCWKTRMKKLSTIVRRDTYLHHYKFPPLTKREINKAPYLKKYAFLKSDSDLTLGQFLDSQLLFDTNKDHIVWDFSPWKDKISVGDGGKIP